MKDIINKIIEIDHMAQKMSDESIELRKEAEKSIENDKKALREQYIAKARKRIEINSKTEEEYLKTALGEISQKSGETEESLRKVYHENKEKWVDEIYNRVIGR